MSAEDLENYETDAQMALYREYKDVMSLFSYAVETDRRFYLANQVDVTPHVQDGTLYLSVINPRTFYIPNTGGAGSWMFTAGGLLIIAGGVVYLAVSRKKKG